MSKKKKLEVTKKECQKKLERYTKHTNFKGLIMTNQSKKKSLKYKSKYIGKQKIDNTPIINKNNFILPKM